MQGFSYLILIPLICFVCYCILLVILLGSIRNKIARYYAFYIVAMIIWSFGSFVMKTNLPPSTLFWNRILCLGLIMMPVVFYHFTLVLTGTNNQLGKLISGYICAVFFLFFNFTGLIMKEAYLIDNNFYYTLGPLAPFMAIWSMCYLILSFTNILNKVKSKQIPFRRVKFILLGLVLVIIGGLLNLIPSLGRYPFDIAFNTINAIFIAYSIYRYRFLEIKLIVKRGIAYSVYTLILSGVYIIAIFTSQQVLIRLLGYSNITLTLLVAVLLALIFQPIKNILQHWIDRVFYKQKLNHQKILKDFSQIINNILELDELTQLLVEVVNKGLQPSQVSLMLREEKNNYKLYYSSIDEALSKEMIYRKDHPILQWFKNEKNLLTIGEIESLSFFAGLWSVEKKQLHSLETELIVPIRFREELIGMIILSERKDGEAYSQQEMDLLYTLVNNVAVVIENAKIYENAKKQANTDGLTKLYNHRYFHERLKEYLSETQHDTFSIAMIDVDLFKLYNDIHGHSAGDRALMKIADVLMKSIRKNDIAARYGGEEFAILFPDMDGKEALEIIESIRGEVEHVFCDSNKNNEFLTISAGVASYPRDGKVAKEVLDSADKAMYIAKHNGRNQSVLCNRKDRKNDFLNDHYDMEKMQNNIESAYLSAIYALAATIDAKDHYTYGHSENVSRYAVKLAKGAGFDKEKIDIVRNAGLLHDIGKIGVPESILTKAEKLTKKEYEIMKKHVDISITIIKHIPNLIKVIPAIMSHHERYDGKGYPRGIKGENIPIEGRCLCIVDAFDAMTTDRPYCKALSTEEALVELRKFSGTQFDPGLVEIFIKLLKEGEIEVA